MTLADPPFLEHFLFENPWPVSAALAAVGLSLLWLARQRGNPRHATLGAIGVLLAIAVIVLSAVVTTMREQAVRQTEQLVEAMNPLRMNKIRAVVDERVSLSGGDEVRSGRSVFAGIEAAADSRLGVESHTIKSMDAELVVDGHVRVMFDVLTIGRGGRRVITRWLLDWRRSSSEGPWKLVAIRWLPSTDTMIGIQPQMGFIPHHPTDDP